MKFNGTDFSVFLVDGHNLAASLSESVSISDESLTQQTNPFGATSEEHTPLDSAKTMMNVGGGFYDEEADALHNETNGHIGLERTIVAAVFGNIIGRPFIGFQGGYSQKYEAMDSRDGLTKANVHYLISGKKDEGVIVQHLATFTADWDTKTGGANATDAPVDYTADPANLNVPITSNSIANPSVVTCPVPHNLVTGQIILISGVATSNPTINGERTVTVISPTTFSVPVNVTVAGAGGSFVRCSTANGGFAYQQVTDFSGFSGFVGSIMHSPDDATYATLVAFANVTAANASERATDTGTVDRYLSFNGNVTGSGSITVFGGFARQ